MCCCTCSDKKKQYRIWYMEGDYVGSTGIEAISPEDAVRQFREVVPTAKVEEVHQVVARVEEKVVRV